MYTYCKQFIAIVSTKNWRALRNIRDKQHLSCLYAQGHSIIIFIITRGTLWK